MKAQAAERMPEPDRDKTDFGWGLSPGLISPSPPHGHDTRGCHHISPERERSECRRRADDRTPLVGASALHGVSGTSSGSHLGSTLGSGKSCPDPGRLSTFGVSGLCPCRRLTYRGACETISTPRPRTRQTRLRNHYGSSSPLPHARSRSPAADAYPRQHGQYSARSQRRDRARPHVHRSGEPDVGVASATWRLRPADDRAGARRRDERVLHPGHPRGRPAAVRPGARDPSGDGRRVRDVVRHLRHPPGIGGARQRRRPGGDDRAQRHQDRRRAADLRPDRSGRCDHHPRR